MHVHPLHANVTGHVNRFARCLMLAVNSRDRRPSHRRFFSYN